MHKVLAEIKSILQDKIPADTRVKKESIKIGNTREALQGLMISDDLPFIIISLDNAPDIEPSPWANHKSEVYRITFIIVMHPIRPLDAKTETNTENQGKTIFEIGADMFQIFSNNKKLNGLVNRWGETTVQWDSRNLTDDEGRQILEIKTFWRNDFLPFDSVSNNQQNSILQPS